MLGKLQYGSEFKCQHCTTEWRQHGDEWERKEVRESELPIHEGRCLLLVNLTE